MKVTAKDLFRVDGWKNLLTGLGVGGRDKRIDYKASWEKMTEYEIEGLYASDEIATKVVDYPVEEMFRKGFTFTHPEADPDFDQQIKALHEKHGTIEKLKKVMKQGRLHGSAYLVLGVEDGKTPSEEMDLEKVRKLNWCQVFSRWELSMFERQKDVTKPYFREPLTYTVTEGDHEGLEENTVHRSRMIRFDGAFLPKNLYERNDYSHDSVLNKIQNSLRNYNMGFDSAAATLQEFSMGIFKMKDLAKLVGSGKEEQIITRLGLIDAKKSMVRSIVLDKEEDYTREDVNLSGVTDILGKTGNKLVADTNIPHTVLLGEGATGTLGGGGMSESRNWYDYIGRKQQNDLKPKLIYLTKLLMITERMKVPEGLDIEFEKLFELTEQEQADVRLKTSQADQIDIQNNVLDPDEVAISRYGTGKYSQATKINTEMREERVIEPVVEEEEVEEEDIENTEE